MVFKVKGRKKKPVVRRPRPAFFREKEIEILRERHKGKVPPFTEITRAGVRRVAGIHARIYKKGRLVQYKGRTAEVIKVSTRGITIRIFSKPKKTGITTPTKRTEFVSAKEIERGKVKPFFTNFPIPLVLLFKIGKD